MQQQAMGGVNPPLNQRAKEQIAIAVCERFNAGSGWTQNAWARDGTGHPIEIESAGPKSCLCLGGAIRIATREVVGTRAQEREDLYLEMAQEYAFAISEHGTQCKHPHDGDWMRVVVQWNDAKGRTATQVRALAGTVRDRMRRAERAGAQR